MKPSVLLILVLLVSITSYAQRKDQKRHLIGYRPTLNQNHLVYKYHFRKNVLILNAGLQYRYVEGYYNAGLTNFDLGIITSAYGPIGEIGYGRTFEDFLQLQAMITYKHTTNDFGIDDEGGFSGSNTSDYDEFWREDKRVGLKLLASFFPYSVIQPYFGVGLRRTDSYKHVTRTGTFSDQAPADFTEEEIWIGPTLHLGVTLFPLRF